MHAFAHLYKHTRTHRSTHLNTHVILKVKPKDYQHALLIRSACVCVYGCMCAWGKTTNLCFSSNHVKIQSRFPNGLLATVRFGICSFGSLFFYSFLQLIIKCTNRIVQFYWGWCHTVWNIKFLELLLVTWNWFCAVCCFMLREVCDLLHRLFQLGGS